MLHLVSPHTTYTSTHTPCKSHCPHVCLLQSGSFLSRHFGDPYRREARRARSSRADVWLSSMVEGRRLCHMLCFTTGYMPICKVRVSGVVRKRRFTRPPLYFRRNRDLGKGVRSRRTRLFGDQLWPADAGSWQIADGSDPRTTRARVTSVGDLRVHFVVERRAVADP